MLDAKGDRVPHLSGDYFQVILLINYHPSLTSVRNVEDFLGAKGKKKKKNINESTIQLSDHYHIINLFYCLYKLIGSALRMPCDSCLKPVFVK